MGRGNNTAGDLQDLVTGILAPNSEEEEAEEQAIEEAPLSEKAQTRKLSQMEILSKGRELEDFLQTADWKAEGEIRDRVADWSSAIVGLRNTHSGYRARSVGGLSPYGEMLFMLCDYLRDPSQEAVRGMYRYCRAFNNGLELSMIQSSIDTSISYLEERWGEESAQKLHELTGTSKSTTKKWMQGSHPASGNQSQIKVAIEMLFTLETGCRMSWEETEKWINAPRQSLNNETPWQFLANRRSTWSMPSSMRDLLSAEIEKAE